MFTSDKRKTADGDPGTPITLLLSDPETHFSLNEVPLEEQVWGLRRLWKAQGALFPLPLLWVSTMLGGSKLPLCLTPLAASRQDELGAPSSWEYVCDTYIGKDFKPGIQWHCFCIDPAAFLALLLGTGRNTQRADQYSIPANTSKLACRGSSF